MSITSLRPIPRHSARIVAGPYSLGAAPHGDATDHDFGLALLRAGRVSAGVLMGALAQPVVPLIDHLIAGGHLPEGDAYDMLAAHWAVGRADFARLQCDASLIARVDAVQCLDGAWVPWRKLGPTTVIACAYPEEMDQLRAKLSPIFGTITFALAPRRDIAAQVLARAGGALARRAENLLDEADSCRRFSVARARAVFAALVGGLAWLAYSFPMALLPAAVMVALGLAFALSALKLAAAAVTLWPQRPATNAAIKPSHPLQVVVGDASLPKISIMVPLFRESRIVARLIRRLALLDYPRSALEVILMIEDTDAATATALAAIDLPPWVRALAVPAGTIRTKPRALNYGLDHCKGQIIGVYDAEDAPEPDQLRRVAQAFARGGPRLACLQGRLDYYNPKVNWLSRCFTIEYANWWRVVLDGFSRMGFAIPLGGTTLFFRHDILVQLGGWDAHNVTEDADLGLRLARRGYETQLLDSTTYEEANCRALPWIKQRSRWIKGYMMTYAAHMRAPRRLLADLGPWRFFGMQMMFAGTVLHALFAPLLMALWLLAFDVLDPADLGLSAAAVAPIAALGILVESLLMMTSYLAIGRAGHRLSPIWIVTMPIYNLLASLAAYKALYELLSKPFYWDKTAHGLFDS